MGWGMALFCALVVWLLANHTNEIKRDRMLKAKHLCAWEEGEANSPEECGCRSCLASIEEGEEEEEAEEEETEPLELDYPKRGQYSPEWTAYQIKLWLTLEERKLYNAALEEDHIAELERLEDLSITREIEAKRK